MEARGGGSPWEARRARLQEASDQCFSVPERSSKEIKMCPSDVEYSDDWKLSESSVTGEEDSLCRWRRG